MWLSRYRCVERNNSHFYLQLKRTQCVVMLTMANTIEMHLIDNDLIKTSTIIDIPIGMNLALLMVDLAFGMHLAMVMVNVVVKMHLAHNVPVGT